LSVLLFVGTFGVAQRATPPKPAPLQPVAPWTLPLFSSDPAAVLSEASHYSAPENADAVVLSYFINVQIDAAGKQTQTARIVTRVLRLQGISAARQVNLAWLPSRQDRPKIKARVITADGKPHLLDQAAVKDNAPPAGPDASLQAHLLSATLPGVDFDSIVELEIVDAGHKSIYPGGGWGEIWLDSRNPIFQFSANLSSESANLRALPRGFPQAIVQNAAKGHVTIDASRIAPPINRVLLPPDIPPSPLITFSIADSWQAIAQWCASHPEALTALFAESGAKAVALIAKLKRQGLDAKPALIRAAPAVELLPNQPGLEPFNRVLVYVPGAQPKWIDPAAESAPLPLTDQARFALVLDSSTIDLIRTPETTAQDNRDFETIDIQLNDGAPATVKTTIDAHGVFEEAQRPKAAQQQQGYPASTVGDVGGFIDLPGPGSVRFRSLGPLLDPRAPDEPDRTLDYYAYPPFTDEVRYHVSLPPGFQFGEIPPVSNIAVGPLTVSGSAKLEADGSLSMTYGLTSPKSRYSPQEGAAIRRDAAQKLAGKAGYRIIFVNTGEELIAKGKPKEALELLLKDAASTNATLRLADAYVASGSRAEAVKVCRQVIAKEPNNAAAYLRLGWIYAHNESGQLYADGMNTAESEKAYRKAIELKPDERAYLVQLATLYTYNCCGVRYGNGARLDDAIDAYTKAGMTALTATRSLNDLAGTLLFAGKYDQLRQFYLYPEAESADPSIRIAGIAASTGASDAREEVSLLSVPQQQKSEILAHAIRGLVLARDYAAAVELGATDPRLRRAKRFNDAALSADPAVAAFQRFVEAALNPSRPGLPGADRSALFKLFNPSAKTPPDSIEWPSIADILATSLDLKSQESGGTYTILAGSKPIAHVVQRGDEFVVLDLVP
jgi:tetratricopeptide (TPR) repeat protein